MRQKGLAIWYILLVIFVLELAVYGVAVFMTDSYRRLMWERFNAGVQQYNEVNGLPYAEIINRCARQYGVDAQVVAAVIKAESSFQSRAQSSSGAFGLMQVIPSTWKQVNNEIKACTGRHQGDCTRECFFNPEINIAIGTAYLGKLYKSYNGDMVRALAAYNAGPGEVERFNGVPPFRETNDYIDRIIIYWYQIQNKPLPGYNLKSEYWKDMSQKLGWLCVFTAILILITMRQLLKRYNSWRWR